MPEQKYGITAYYVAKSLNLAEIEKKNDLSLVTKRRNSLFFQPTNDRMAAVFSFGVVVLFNFDEKLAVKFVKSVAKYGEDPLEKPKTDEYHAVIDPEQKTSVEFESVRIQKIDQEAIHVISEVLAQSVAIEYVEERVDQFMGRFERIYGDLERGGRLPVSDVEAKKMIGAGRNVIQYVVTKLSLLDKPDSTWEEKDIENLFMGMRKMFELDDRFRALEFRLDFIHESSELIMDILQNRRSMHLEVAIVVLFVIDIVLVLYEMFFRGGHI